MARTSVKFTATGSIPEDDGTIASGPLPPQVAWIHMLAAQRYENARWVEEKVLRASYEDTAEYRATKFHGRPYFSGRIVAHLKQAVLGFIKKKRLDTGKNAYARLVPGHVEMARRLNEYYSGNPELHFHPTKDDDDADA